jgi:hypothetical protein
MTPGAALAYHKERYEWKNEKRQRRRERSMGEGQS